MNEGDYELDGYAMGLAHDVVVEDVDLGTSDWIVQDQVAQDGRRIFGSDHVSGPTMVLSLATNVGDVRRAKAALNAVASAWRPAHASVAGAESVLRYMIDGEIRRVYGRPRKFAPAINGLLTSGDAAATAEFVTSDGLAYDDVERAAVVRIVPPATGGFTAPFVAPIITATTGVAQGVIEDVGGDEPAPFEVEIQGPVNNPRVSGDGWALALQGSIAYDRSVTIDTRNYTVLDNDGNTPSVKLSLSSNLLDARLRPGPDYLRFEGIDPTGTATATIRWRPVYKGL